MKKNIIISLLIAISSLSLAEIKTPAVIGDNMLLQRDSLVKIWGKADANATVDVAFGGQKKSTKADAKGDWSLKLDKMPANKNPQEMIISENGKVGKTIKNILVGEVWVAGGQSNMAWILGHSTDAKSAMHRAKYPTMRYFKQTYTMAKTPQFDTEKTSQWIVANGENMERTSAVAFYFAEKLMKDLDVPVAIIYTARGATKMSCWLPREYHSKSESYKTYLDRFEKVEKTYSEAIYKKRLAEHSQMLKDVEAKKRKRPSTWSWRIAPNPMSPWFDFDTPSYLYNGMVAPIANYTTRGVIWYQGESDTGAKEKDFFAEKFSILVNSWRDKFDNKDMAFYWVQLAPFSTNNDWPVSRWQQLKARDMIKNSGIVNIIDAGEQKDIHPKDKTTVGTRLASLALKNTYKQDVYAFAPEFKSAKYDGDTAIVELETYGRKLEFKSYARGFEVCVKGNWINANASLDGNKLIVKSPEGSEISGVRYLWKNWCMPDVCLYNEDGLPAFSFTNSK